MIRSLYIGEPKCLIEPIMRDLNHYLRDSILLLTLIMLFATPLPANSQVNDDVKLRTTNSNITTNQDNFWYNENVYLDIARDGWIWSQVSLDGSDILFGNIDVGSLMPIEMLNIFRHISIDVHGNQNPWEDNANVWFRFQTNDPDLAEQYANLILLYLGEYISVDLRFDGSQGTDDWDGEVWKQFTDVKYNGHIDWINMQGVIDTAIPRELGGLAANVDATYATDLSFNFWYEHHNQNIAGSIGLYYQQYVPGLSGGHTISYGDIMHIETFEKSPFAGEFRVGAALPDVTNPAFSVQPTIPAQWEYHPNPEGVDYHHYWNGGFSLPTGQSLDDVVLSFDFEFRPWEFVNQENYWWNVDPRGYDNLWFEATGNSRISPTDGLYTTNQTMQDIASLNFWLSRGNNLRMEVGFYNGIHDTEFNNILLELGTIGIDYSTAYNVNNNSQWNWHNWVEDKEYSINWYSFEISISDAEYESIITSMPGYQTSAILQSANLTTFGEFEWYIQPGSWSNQAKMSINRNALANNLPLAQVDRLFNEVGSSHSVSLFQPYLTEWGNFPWNSYTETLTLHFEAPFTGELEDVSFTPQENNGLYWDSGRWVNKHDRFNYFTYSVRIYNQNPQLILNDDIANPIGPFNDASVTFSNNFLSDTVDIDAPDIEDVRSNPTFNTNFNTWDGEIATNQYMDEVYYVTKIQDEHDDRFPSSGVSQVNASLFRTDAPVDHEKFLFNEILTRNGPWPGEPARDAWYFNLDTTKFADGEWELWFEMKDNSNNERNWGSEFLNIDNYNETYLPSNIVWDSQAPTEGSDIAGIMSFDFTVHDDAGSFAVVVWSNLGGFVIDPTNVITNGTGIYEFYSFELDTLFEAENAPLTLKIEVLDLDGHWSTIDRGFVVNNYITGSAPQITLLTPDDGDIFDGSEQSEIEFSVEVSEDVGIRSAEIFFDGPSSPSFVLTNTPDSNVWTETINIQSWEPGAYTWYVEVVDLDENTHFQKSTTRNFEIVGNSLFPDNDPPVLSELNFADGDIVSKEITIRVKATDNIGIQEVSIEYYQEKKNTMDDVGSNYYEFQMNTAEVVDKNYDITIIAKDFKGNSDSITISLEFNNGRKDKAPGLGIPGFGFYLTLISILSLVLIHRKKNHRFKMK